MMMTFLPRYPRWQARLRRLRHTWQEFKRQPLGLLGLILIACFGVMAVLHPILMMTVWNRMQYDPSVGFDATIMPHPTAASSRHLLGTDNFGRDVLSQLLAGAQVSFAVGIIAALIAVTLSTLLGGIAGYARGWSDTILMGVADVFVLLPAPVILLIFGLLLRMNWWSVAVAYGILTGLGGQIIVVKSRTLSLMAKPFIEAAKIAGGNRWHIIQRHILPGLIPLSVVHAVFTVVGAVLTESLLSFFGRTRYHLSWGTMIWFGQETFRLFTMAGQWHAIIAPALSIMLFCSGFYLVGRALDAVLNPKLRSR